MRNLQEQETTNTSVPVVQKLWSLSTRQIAGIVATHIPMPITSLKNVPTVHTSVLHIPEHTASALQKKRAVALSIN